MHECIYCRIALKVLKVRSQSAFGFALANHVMIAIDFIFLH